MNTEFLLTGNLFWMMIVWLSLIALTRFVGVLFPNYGMKRYISGKWKLNDNVDRFLSLVFLLIFLYFILTLLGVVTN